MTGSPIDGWLDEARERRRQAGVRRTLRPRQPGEPLLNLAGNDYLGLGRDPRVIEAGVAALRAWGAGSTGSRLVTGSTALHDELEAELAAFAGAESALVFASGYAANLGVISALTDASTLVVSDASNHASIVDACRLSRARVQITPHADVAAVGKALANRTEPRAAVITDAVFSTFGDAAPLAELHAQCRAHGALLIVDEAHSLGVRGPGGRGLCAEVGLAGEPDVVVTVTLSKALASQGGAVLAPPGVRDHLVNTARTFIFDTGLAPASAGAALGALRILRDQPDLAAAVQARAAQLATALDAGDPAAAVVAYVLGEPERTLAAADACRQAGVLVGCFRPPTVPVGSSMLRLTARADLTDEVIDTAVAVVRDAVTSDLMSR